MKKLEKNKQKKITGGYRIVYVYVFDKATAQLVDQWYDYQWSVAEQWFRGHYNKDYYDVYFTAV